MMRTASSRSLCRALRPGAQLLKSYSQSQLPRRSLASSANPLQNDPVELDNITTLPNGIRVATEALPGHFSGIGVYVDAGSRYENNELRGVSHIMDRLAFKSTRKRSGDEMLETIESLGGNIQCASSRESLMYQAATFNSAVPTTVGLLAETIRDPLITDDEVQQQLETASYEIGEIWSKPELILPELVHVAAYKDNTLGNPLLCPSDRLSQINRSTIEAYRSLFFRPERIVLAFAGVKHEEAVRLAEMYFGDMKASEPPTISESSIINPELMPEYAPEASAQYSSVGASTPQQPSKLLSRIPFIKNISTSAASNAAVSSGLQFDTSSLDLTAPSVYTGGFLTLPDLPAPVNPHIPALTHIHLAFEALPISSDDIFALATLQTLLGGGGSFSAGGPGKGMYSRLYTNVLNQHGWVESCVAFNHSYTDSGLFGISASCSPIKVAHMLDVMCRELQCLTLTTGFSALTKAEVARAKNQLRSSLLMNLESRMVELEDLGRQVQVHGRKVGVKEMCEKIEALTVDDLRRVAQHVFGGYVKNPGGGGGAPTVVLQKGAEPGVKVNLGWEEIQDRIAKWKLGRRPSLSSR